MARTTKNIVSKKNKQVNKQEKKPKLTMTPLEIRNARKSFLMKEEMKYEQKRAETWQKLLELEGSREFATIEKKEKEDKLFKIISETDDELIKINEQLTVIERQEDDEKHQEALKNIIEIGDEYTEVGGIIIIDLND